MKILVYFATKENEIFYASEADVESVTQEDGLFHVKLEGGIRPSIEALDAVWIEFKSEVQVQSAANETQLKS